MKPVGARQGQFPGRSGSLDEGATQSPADLMTKENTQPSQDNKGRAGAPAVWILQASTAQDFLKRWESAVCVTHCNLKHTATHNSCN